MANQKPQDQKQASSGVPKESKMAGGSAGEIPSAAKAGAAPSPAKDEPKKSPEVKPAESKEAKKSPGLNDDVPAKYRKFQKENK